MSLDSSLFLNCKLTHAQWNQRFNCLGCPFCVNQRGRKKNHKTLWRLQAHLAANHETENYTPVICKLAGLIKEGVIF